MTTVETELFTLLAACEAAGEGGQIYRSGTVYNVSKVDDQWHLQATDGCGAPDPITNGWTPDGWAIHSRATRWLSLAEACGEVGVGGTVRFSRNRVDAGADYTVSHGAVTGWALTGGEYVDEPIGSFDTVSQDWTVVRDEPVAPEVVTVSAFFANMHEGTYVLPGFSPGTHYIFKGWEFDDGDGNRYVRLVHSRYMEFSDIKDEALQADSAGWSIVKEDDGETDKVADAALRQALRHIGSLRNEVRNISKVLDDVNKLYRDVKGDFELLNKHLGDYAQRNHMCSDYEKQLWEWNETFTAMKLKGRERNYWVPVTVPWLRDGETVYVQADTVRSPEEAKSKVEAMDDGQILQALVAQGYFSGRRSLGQENGTLFPEGPVPYC